MNTECVCITIYSFPPQTYDPLLTVQDIVMSNPLRSAGVTELETVTLYTVIRASKIKTQMLIIYLHVHIHNFTDLHILFICGAAVNIPKCSY